MQTFDPNITCGSRVISILLTPQPAEMMHTKPSSIEKGCCACQWLDNVDIYFILSSEINAYLKPIKWYFHRLKRYDI